MSVHTPAAAAPGPAAQVARSGLVYQPNAPGSSDLPPTSLSRSVISHPLDPGGGRPIRSPPPPPERYLAIKTQAVAGPERAQFDELGERLRAEKHGRQQLQAMMTQQHQEHVDLLRRMDQQNREMREQNQKQAALLEELYADKNNRDESGIANTENNADSMRIHAIWSMTSKQ
ncbi:hypothetical protein K438DRAFT_1993237 [Mycena galopus ATCC 62051]|nr:hypothetical protein K438DRAFT_1993237 [Mycena galopus ATCC 62051]